MTRIITISKAVLQNWIRSREGVFFSVLFPVLLLVIFGAVFGGDGSSSFSLYVQNFDVFPNGTATPMSSTFIQALNSSGVVSIPEVIPTNVSDPVEHVQDKLGFFGGSPRVMVIPQGFGDNLLNGSIRARIAVINSTVYLFLARFSPYMNASQLQAAMDGVRMLNAVGSQLPGDNASITLILDPSQSSSAMVESIVVSFVQSFNYGMIGAQPFFEVERQGFTARSFEAVEYYLPGYIGAFIMTNGVMGVAGNTAEFKRRGILRRLATTPLTKLEWVMGNVIAQTILGFLLTGVMILTGYVVFRITALPDLLSLTLIIAGAVAFSGMGLVIAGSLRDVEAVTSVGNALSFPMMFLSGSFVPLEVMPDYLQTVAQFLPLTYLSNGLRSSLITGDVGSALLNLALVSTVGVMMILLGAWLTRWKEP